MYLNIGADFYLRTEEIIGIFDLDTFKRFLEQVDKAGIKTHIMAGIIPLKAAGMAKYMNENVPGIDVPQHMIDRLAAAAAEGRSIGGLKWQLKFDASTWIVRFWMKVIAALRFLLTKFAK